MTITARINSFDYDRPPLEFGIEWDRTNSNPVTSITRLGDAIGLVVDTSDSPHASDFTAYMPWKGMKRYNMNSNGDVLYAWGETGYLDSVRTLVRIPYFFYKLELDTPTADKWRYWISPYPLSGYRIHPAFLRWDATYKSMRITDIYVGAFEAEVTTGANSIAGVAPKVSYSRHDFRDSFAGRTVPVPPIIISSLLDDYSGGWRTSLNQTGTKTVGVKSTTGFQVGATVSIVSGVNNETNTIASINTATKMTMINNLAHTYADGGTCSETIIPPDLPVTSNIIDWPTWNALLWLCLVEYAVLDLQTPSGSAERGGLSKGITNGAAVEKTGWTSSIDVNENGFHSVDLGNLSGQVQCRSIGGIPVYASSFHGVENLLGNTWTALDAVNINTDRCFWIAKTPVCFDQTTFSDPYEKTAFYAPSDASTSYLSYPDSYVLLTEGDWAFGNWITSANPAIYTRDPYIPPTSWAAPRYPAVGGDYLNGGLWALMIKGYTDISASLGTRLMQIPLDTDFWRY